MKFIVVDEATDSETIGTGKPGHPDSIELTCEEVPIEHNHWEEFKKVMRHFRVCYSPNPSASVPSVPIGTLQIYNNNTIELALNFNANDGPAIRMWTSNTQIDLESTEPLKWNISGAIIALRNDKVLLGSMLIDLVSENPTAGDPGFMSSGVHDYGIMTDREYLGSSAEAPTLSSVSIVSKGASTTVAKVGDVITVTFTANKIIKPPVVTFKSGSIPVTYTNTSITNIGREVAWAASYIARASDTNGNVTYRIAFTDSADIAGVDVTSGTGSVTFEK